MCFLYNTFNIYFNIFAFTAVSEVSHHPFTVQYRILGPFSLVEQLSLINISTR